MSTPEQKLEKIRALVDVLQEDMDKIKATLKLKPQST